MVEDLIKRIRRDVAIWEAGDDLQSSQPMIDAANLIEQQAARLTALESERDALLAAAGKEAVKITEPAQVAGSVFRAGISCDTVIKAAQRNYKYRNDPAVQDYPDRFTLAQIQAMDSIVPQGDREFVSLKDYQAAALGNGDGRDAWISVDDRLPKCSRAKGSLGVEVLVWPLTESGEATAFYGRRVTDTPAFYRYGAVINRITHWQPLPSPPAGLSQKAGEQQ